MEKFQVGDEVVTVANPPGLNGSQFVGLRGIVLDANGRLLVVRLEDKRVWSYWPEHLLHARPFVKPPKKSELLVHGVGDHWVGHWGQKEGASIIKVEPIEGRPKELKVTYKYWIKLRQQSGFIIIGKYAKRDRAFALIRKYAQERMKTSVAARHDLVRILKPGDTLLVFKEEGVREECVTVVGARMCGITGLQIVIIEAADGTQVKDKFFFFRPVWQIAIPFFDLLSKARKPNRLPESQPEPKGLFSKPAMVAGEPIAAGAFVHAKSGVAYECKKEQSAPQEPFKVGDVVRLKSGGPKMTIRETRIDGLVCEFFQQHKDGVGVYSAVQEMLERA